MIEKLALVVTVTALCMVSPGPDMLLVMRNTLIRNGREGYLTAVGVLTGNLVHIAYCVIGIALLLSQRPGLFDGLRIAGAIYLVYLGVQGLRAGRVEPRPSVRTDSGHPYLQGLANNLLNPKGSLFYLGVFTQVITPDLSWSQTVLLVNAMMVVSVIFWVVFIEALRLPMFRTALDGWSVALNRVFGIVLILVGARIAIVR